MHTKRELIIILFVAVLVAILIAQRPDAAVIKGDIGFSDLTGSCARVYGRQMVFKMTFTEADTAHLDSVKVYGAAQAEVSDNFKLKYAVYRWGDLSRIDTTSEWDTTITDLTLADLPYGLRPFIARSIIKRDTTYGFGVWGNWPTNMFDYCVYQPASTSDSLLRKDVTYTGAWPASLSAFTKVATKLSIIVYWSYTTAGGGVVHGVLHAGSQTNVLADQSKTVGKHGVPQ